jgi:hypothetical protein
MINRAAATAFARTPYTEGLHYIGVKNVLRPAIGARRRADL